MSVCFSRMGYTATLHSLALGLDELITVLCGVREARAATVGLRRNARRSRDTQQR